MPPSAYSMAVEITSLLTLWVGLSAWQRDRRTPGGVWLTALTAAVLLWNVGVLFEDRQVVGISASDRIRYLGVLSVPPLWLGFAAHAARVDLARRVPWFPVALLVPSAVFYVLMNAGPWSTVFLDSRSGRVGPLFDVWSYYGWTLIAAGAALLLLATARWPRRGQWVRRAGMVIGASLPLLGNILYATGHAAWERDPTPILIGATVLALRAAIFHGGLLDLLPIDQKNLLLQLPVGIVITDASGSVIEVNPAAEARVGLGRDRALGRSLEGLLARLPEAVPVRIESISGTGTGARCAVIGEAGGVGRIGRKAT